MSRAETIARTLIEHYDSYAETLDKDEALRMGKQLSAFDLTSVIIAITTHQRTSRSPATVQDIINALADGKDKEDEYRCAVPGCPRLGTIGSSQAGETVWYCRDHDGGPKHGPEAQRICDALRREPWKPSASLATLAAAMIEDHGEEKTAASLGWEVVKWLREHSVEELLLRPKRVA